MPIGFLITDDIVFFLPIVLAVVTAKSYPT